MSLKLCRPTLFDVCGLSGVLGVGIGLAVGMALAILLITVSNKPSFGWTIPWTVSLEPMVMACLVDGIAVLMGAWFPSQRVAR